MHDKTTQLASLVVGSGLLVMAHCSATIAQTTNQEPTAQPMNYGVVVTSNQDGAIQPDDALTLREAIALVNGQLKIEQLSEGEKTLVTLLSPDTASRIEFNLPSTQTTIYLNQLLPPLASPGLVIDGTSQPGYDASRSATAEIEIPIPVVAITPAPGQEILRGLTIVADGVTVRGLSLYGFARLGNATLNTPPSDIFVDRPLPPPDVIIQPSLDTVRDLEPNPEAIASSSTPNLQPDISPKDVVIEFNWLGIPPNEGRPETTSAFGVSVFNSLGTTIQRNRIANHQGSGIITAIQAKNLSISQNIIVGNGIEGMPDAIRLEGVINDSQITANLICGNDGSGVYLFKPEGAVQIRDNQITFNGRRLRRAAVYLMGDNHQVINNQIGNQPGPGVVVTSYPKSSGNVIEGNRFTELEGLSIDLNTQQHVESVHFQLGDGPNPPRNSANQRKETGNSAINAPQFLSSEFLLSDAQVTLSGQVDPGSDVTIYRVSETGDSPYGPLSEPLTTTTTNEQGEFSVTLNTLQPGDRVSAIATHPQYGTSEPALNALVQSPDGLASSTQPPNLQPPNLQPSNLQPSNLQPSTSQPPNPVIPQCTTPPPELVQAPPEPIPTEPLTLRVPSTIHFALDQATLSPASAVVLDEIVAVLQSYSFLIVEIQGHTDPRASDAYNQELGNQRALAARNYLLRRGIAPERMTIRSFGEMQRQTTGTDRLDYARDRRVEFIFQDARGLEIIFEDQEADLQVEPTGGTR